MKEKLQKEIHDFNSAITRLSMTINLVEGGSFRDEIQKRMYIDASKAALADLQRIYSTLIWQSSEPEARHE